MSPIAPGRLHDIGPGHLDRSRAMKPTYLGLPVLLLVLSACGHPTATIGTEKTAAGYDGTPKRMFVSARLDRGVEPDITQDFIATMQSDLARCGVTADIYVPDAVELDAAARIRERVRQLQPDTLLSVSETVREISGVDSSVGGHYLAILTDLQTRREVWVAGVQLEMGSPLAGRHGGGIVFADTLMQHMSRSGVLRSCPAPTGSAP